MFAWTLPQVKALPLSEILALAFFVTVTVSVVYLSYDCQTVKGTKASASAAEAAVSGIKNRRFKTCPFALRTR